MELGNLHCHLWFIMQLLAGAKLIEVETPEGPSPVQRCQKLFGMVTLLVRPSSTC